MINSCTDSLNAILIHNKYTTEISIFLLDRDLFEFWQLNLPYKFRSNKEFETVISDNGNESSSISERLFYCFPNGVSYLDK